MVGEYLTRDTGVSESVWADTGVAIHRGPVEFSGAGVTLAGYCAEPVSGAQTQIVFVHENRGIDPYIQEVAEGLASHGHDVLVPDLLTRLGGSSRFHSQDDAREIPSPREVPHATHLADLEAVVDAYGVRSPVYVAGFCFGGELAWRLAARRPGLAGVAVFYGAVPADGQTEAIAVPSFGVFADEDSRINPGVPRLWTALDEHGVPFSMHRFAGTLHAFHNHRRPERHDPAAATSAWRLLLQWLSSSRTRVAEHPPKRTEP